MAENKILVIRGGAIGDFILTMPVLAALRAQFPRSRLEVLGYPHIAQLALAGGLVDAVRPIEAGPLAGFFARGGTLDAGWQDYFAGFALIISYLYDPDRIFQDNLARSSKALYLAGPHRPDERAGVHAAHTFLKPLERLAIFDADPVPRLKLEAVLARAPARWGGGGSSDTNAAEAREKPFVPDRLEVGRTTLGLHPGSGSERKNWPEARWTALLRDLAESTDWRFLLVGGEAEGGRLDRLATGLPRARLQWACHLPLAELARKLTCCQAFVGHDSGISHLAAALGLSTLVLWGDTAEAVWRPVGDHVRLVREAGGLGHLAVETVVASLRGLLGQSADP